MMTAHGSTNSLHGLMVMATVLSVLFAVVNTSSIGIATEKDDIIDHSLKFRPVSSYLQLREQILKERIGALLRGGPSKPEDVQSCNCQNLTCGCCIHIDIDDKVKINQTGCVTLTYLPDELGLELQVTLDGFVIIDRKVSVKNPPPICAAIPYVHKLASICIKFYQLDFVDKHLTGCVELDVEFAEMDIAHLKMGCFRLPPYVKGQGLLHKNGHALFRV